MVSADRTMRLARVYAAHADRLQVIVRAKVHVPAGVIEDAGQNAWPILVRRKRREPRR